MSDRSALIDAFLAAAGWPGAARRPLAADASFRRYERVALGARRAVLMDAPPDREDIRPFVTVARRLSAMGFGAPAILAEDAVRGFLLLEDLGDATFTRLLEAGADEGELYRLATDVLIELHRRPRVEAVPEGLPPYDDDRLLAEASLLTDWYLPAALPGSLGDDAVVNYREIWRGLFPLARAVPETLVLRDFHVDNLMRVESRGGIAACGLLDFQDAVVGPVSYDFVSLVEDARRDVADDVAAACRTRYLEAFPGIDAVAFDASCAVLGAQRHCKVLGIFTRLRDRDGKPDYLRHVPRLWRLLERSVSHPALAPLADWLDRHVPPDRRIVPPERSAA